MKQFLLSIFILPLIVACGTTSGMSPRQTAMVAADHIEPVLVSVGEAKLQGLLGDEAEAQLERYGPDVRAAVGGLFDQARLCVVVDGKLESDPSAAGDCNTTQSGRAIDVVAGTLLVMSDDVGAQTDQGIQLRRASFILGLVKSRLARGVRKQFDVEEDTSLAAFDARMLRLESAANLLTPDIPDS